MAKEGQSGIITFGNGTTSRVKLVEIEESRSGMFPADYWFTYEEGETNRPLVHPSYGKSPIIKQEILLPEQLALQVFTPDPE